MKSLLALAAGAAVVLLSIAATPVDAADDVLKICLDENLPPLSVHHRGAPDSGFDVALAQAVASQLDRPLKIQWFESKLDEDSSPTFEANALLSDGLCSLVGSYALTKDTGPDHRRRVQLGVLQPSRPTLYSPLTVILGPNARDRHIAGVGDLTGLRIGIESGTLADAILMTFEGGRLIDGITHLVPGRDDLLGTLDRGELDATLLDSRRFDAYRAAHPDTRIVASGYFYPIGVNRGYVGLASDPALLTAVDRTLADLQTSGKIAELAQTAGLTFLPPREPAILDDAMMKVLQK
jgi:ABC-type amino acid transport substrate-binding protein